MIHCQGVLMLTYIFGTAFMPVKSSLRSKQIIEAMKKGRNWESLTKFAKKNKSWMFTTFNILGLKALTTQTWVMKRNCSSCGLCYNLTDHCWREWQSSGKILVGFAHFSNKSKIHQLLSKTWLVQVSKAKIQKLISEEWEFLGCKTSCKNRHHLDGGNFPITLLFRYFAKQFGTAAKHILSHSHHPKFG